MGLCDDGLDGRLLLLKELAYTMCGTACTDTSYKDINCTVCIFPNLGTCVLIVSCDVIRI